MSDVVKDVVNEEEEKKELLTPSEYFEKVMSMKEETSIDTLKSFYDMAMSKFKKYMITGQKDAARHLYNLCELATREMKIIESGITSFVYREDIDTFIDKVADDCVVIIELADYEREIPDDIVDKIVMCKENNLFDKYYIVFTDYTGEKRSKVEEKKRAKDPIIFGNCLIEGRVSDRMYFIGDWEDEYCHLTLDKMINQMAEKYENGENIKKEVTPPLTLEDAKKILNGASEEDLISEKNKKPARKPRTTKKTTKSSEAKTTKSTTTKRGRKKKTDEE